jgi:hypothetical protein
MQFVRAAGLVLCAAAASGPAGCAGTALAPEPAAGVNLSGAWKLNHGASDDPQKVLAQMRAQAVRLLSRRQSAPLPDRGRGAGSRQQEPVADEDPLPAGPGGRRPDPLLRSPMAHVILSTIERGDFLTVHQSTGALVFDYGTSQRSFTPGSHSVVSAEGGVGDQTSGWKGREYVIEIRAQLGPDVTERYGLSADGRQLIEKLHIAAGELSAFDLTRVYDPTTESAPRQLPTSD